MSGRTYEDKTSWIAGLRVVQIGLIEHFYAPPSSVLSLKEDTRRFLTPVKTHTRRCTWKFEINICMDRTNMHISSSDIWVTGGETKKWNQPWDISGLLWISGKQYTCTIHMLISLFFSPCTNFIQYQILYEHRSLQHLPIYNFGWFFLVFCGTTGTCSQQGGRQSFWNRV